MTQMQERQTCWRTGEVSLTFCLRMTLPCSNTSTLFGSSKHLPEGTSCQPFDGVTLLGGKGGRWRRDGVPEVGGKHPSKVVLC